MHVFYDPKMSWRKNVVKILQKNSDKTMNDK